MHCGMFGKLPSKRDFVSYNMARPFLDHWENWLQTGVASSRLTLGNGWQNSFLNAPIWRFWFGEQIFGQQVTGAVMPSVDGVGRYFPLSVCACTTNGSRLVAPPSQELNVWHDACEQFLLRMLEDKLEGDPSTLLAELPFAPFNNDVLSPPVIDNPATWIAQEGSLDAAFASLQARNEDALHGKRSYWWTMGGANHQANLIAHVGRTSPDFMTVMLKGAKTS